MDGKVWGEKKRGKKKKHPGTSTALDEEIAAEDLPIGCGATVSRQDSSRVDNESFRSTIDRSAGRSSLPGNNSTRSLLPARLLV